MTFLRFCVIAVDNVSDYRYAAPKVLPEDFCGLADEAAPLGLEDGDSADIDLVAVSKSGRFNVSALLYLNFVLKVGFIPLVIPFLSI